MPKIVTKEEKNRAKQLIYQKTEALIKRVGFKGVTVTAICQEVPIGKGTFYYYYPSKEVLLFEIFEQHEKLLMQQIKKSSQQNLSKEENIIRAITEIYLGEGSLVTKITPEEVRGIINALPPNYREQKVKRGVSFFGEVMIMLDIDPRRCNMEVVGELLDSINFIAARQSIQGSATKEALQIMIKSLASYMAQ
ncbi:MAG: TetR/AcrR family transcriptional regulator [Cellulosilyticaceae bacterium]